MHEWLKVTDKGEADTCAGRSVGPSQAKAQTPRDGAALVVKSKQGRWVLTLTSTFWVWPGVQRQLQEKMGGGRQLLRKGVLFQLMERG